MHKGSNGQGVARLLLAWRASSLWLRSMLQMLAFTYWVNNAVERAWEVLVQQGPFLYWVATRTGLFC